MVHGIFLLILFVAQRGNPEADRDNSARHPGWRHHRTALEGDNVDNVDNVFLRFSTENRLNMMKIH